MNETISFWTSLRGAERNTVKRRTFINYAYGMLHLDASAVKRFRGFAGIFILVVVLLMSVNFRESI